MGELGKIHQLIIPVFGHNIAINLEVVIMTWIVFVLLIALGLFASYKRKILPRPIQALGELIISLLYGLTEGMSFQRAGDLASMASAEIVTRFGPRLKSEQTRALLKSFKAGN